MGNTAALSAYSFQSPPPPESNSRREGYEHIADIAKERIRRAIAKLSKGTNTRLNDAKASEDLGFKVFKLVRSNIRKWEPKDTKSIEEYSVQIKLLNDPLISNWKEEDLIYEIALLEGYSPNLKIDKLRISGANIHTVKDLEKETEFKICLDSSLRLDKIKGLSINHDELFVCRDIAIDDSTAANLALQYRLKTI